MSYYVSRDSAYDVRHEEKERERDEKDAVIYHSRDNLSAAISPIFL